MNRAEYQQYLQSDHWKELRAKKLSHSKRRCAICGDRHRLEVHHLQYRNIFDVELTDLRVLCSRCHDLFHELKRTGKIKLKDSSHHGLFCQTKHYVKVALGMARPKKSENQVTIALNKLRTIRGGFTSETIKSFGVPWPPPHGWTKQLVLQPDGSLVFNQSPSQSSPDSSLS